MDREPLGLYIIRLLTGLGLIAFMVLLWWSSSLLEEDVNHIRSDIAEIKNELALIRSRENRSPMAPIKQRSIDSSMPNLLLEDVFYEKTLPKMLGEGFHPQGTRHLATLGKPKNLHPFSNWSQVSAWNNACTDSVANQEFGKWETLSPALAIRMEVRERGDVAVSEYWVYLRDNIFWKPLSPILFQGEVELAPWFLQRHQVTAHDFKFYFDALMNPHVQEAGAVALRNYLGEIEEIAVVDDLTFVVRWKPTLVDGEPKIPYIAKLMTGALRPLPRFVYQYFADGTKIIADDDPNTYRTNSVWAQNFSKHWARNIIVSCGPWIFANMSDKQVTFQRNPHHYNPLYALVKRQEVVIRENPDSIWQDFKAGKLDSYNLQPDQLLEWEDFRNSEAYKEQQTRGMGIKRLDYLARSYVYIGWNQATPYFQSKKVRRAMTLAIDRQRIIDDILNGLGTEITGPFSPSSPSYNPSIEPYPYDPTLAKRLLEEEGWYDTDGDGIRDKVIDGKRIPFRFTLTYYVKNPTTEAICNYVATAFQEIGIGCHLNGVDIADLSGAFDGKSFDAIVLGWALGSPPEEPRQLWHSSGAKEKGSSNAIGFINQEADRIIEELRFEEENENRTALYHRFHAIIHEEAPYTFLYAPKTALLYREYLQNVFIPVDRQDLIPGANVDQPQPQVWWMSKQL